MYYDDIIFRNEVNGYTVEEKIEIAICNDLVTGTMGEKVLWDYLIENLKETLWSRVNLFRKNACRPCAFPCGSCGRA